MKLALCILGLVGGFLLCLWTLIAPVNSVASYIESLSGWFTGIAMIGTAVMGIIHHILFRRGKR